MKIPLIFGGMFGKKKKPLLSLYLGALLGVQNAVATNESSQLLSEQSWLRGSSDMVQDDAYDSGAFAVASSDLMKVISDIQLNPPSDIEDGPDALKASAKALSLVQEQISDPKLIAAFPSNFQPVLEKVAQEIARVEVHVQSIEKLVSTHFNTDGNTVAKLESKRHSADLNTEAGRHLLSRGNTPRAPYTRASPADYHIRATRRSPGHYGIGHGYHHQQGYHAARKTREEGGMNRRLGEDGVCFDLDTPDRKKEQCDRLAGCAVNYNLYDLFVFYFGDDIDFDTGAVDDKEKIKVEDEAEVRKKLDDIQALSQDILGSYNDGMLVEGGTCDQLLQLFHRFDEELSVKGKWQGGSVTGICRGWGTNKFMSLQSIYHISSVLSVEAQVDDCLQDLVDQFNRDPENFNLPNKPCKEELVEEDGVTPKFEFLFDADGQLTVDRIVGDFKQKFDCLEFSFLYKSGFCPRHESCGIADGKEVYTCDSASTTYINEEACNTSCVDSCGTSHIHFEDGDSCGISEATGLFTCTEDPHRTYVVESDRDDACSTGKGTSKISLMGYDNGCKEDNCRGMLFNPVFKADNRFGWYWFFSSKPAYFDYDIPVILPSRRERMGWVDGKPSYGRFIWDVAPVTDMVAEGFIADVFTEYMNCASDIVERLTDSSNPIFSFDTMGARTNPYASDQDNPNQFRIPVNIETSTAIDEHGQFKKDEMFVDKIFRFLDFGDSGFLGDLTAFKENLAERWHFLEVIDGYIDYFTNCPIPDFGSICTKFVAYLEDLRDDYDPGIDSTSLDASIALLFGNKTTIGQVCSYARGLSEDTVQDLPGWCCLDAPYESQIWGEKFTCEKYNERGRIVAKDTTDCNRLAPLTAGFNEYACDVYHGTWCPIPRNCTELVDCLEETKAEVEGDPFRQAFYAYLDDAPEVEFSDDPVKCGELREYFDYDKNYPDDERICDEVKALQCFTDFENLDGYATGTAGPDGAKGLADLAVSEKLITTDLDYFNSAAAEAWKIANVVIEKVLEVLDDTDKTVDILTKVCTTLISMFPGTSAGCTIPATVLQTIVNVVKFILTVALAISENLYEKIVDGQNGDFEAARQRSIYENVITNHGNIITTFYATQQLKVMLGEISEGIARDEEEDENRRLNDCVNVTSFYSPCDYLLCDDFTKYCDGGPNYPLIAGLKGAGCDDLDSDGDGKKDICEDRFPPELVLRNAEMFRCDELNTERLCYNARVFPNEILVENFLRYQFPASDDCAATKRLEVEIAQTSGSCRDTVYTITPFQNIPGCNDYPPVIYSRAGVDTEIPFVNPLSGSPRTVTVALDVHAPVATCGFRPDGRSFNEVSEDGKTLYHYMSIADVDGHRLSDAQLFYNVTDNCNDDVRVNIDVRSNEVQQNDIPKLLKHSSEGFVEQATLLYAPTTCANIAGAIYCWKNPYDVRYYQVDVTATDSAGHTGTDTCRVVIVSSCNPLVSPDICKAHPLAKGFYFERSYVDNAIGVDDQILHEVAELELVWKPSDSFPIVYPPPVPCTVDNDAPVVQCTLGTQQLSGKGAGVYVDLKLSSTVVDGGEKCTDTKDLDVVVKVLSNEVEDGGNKMALISESPDNITSGVPSVWAKDITCKTASSGKCKISSAKRSRVYIVKISAMDKAGLVGVGECSTIVGQQDLDPADPIFLIEEASFVGGFDDSG